MRDHDRLGFRAGDWRRGSWFYAVAAAIIATAPAATAGPAPIHLLLITLDTLRADHLGAYGYEAPTSPAIDELARGATLFTDVTCSMPTTLPSHVTIFTGLTPAQHGITANGMVANRELTSVFELLGERGARTAAVVSARVLGEEYLAGLGIGEHFLDDGGTNGVYQVAADAVTRRAIAWLSEHGEESFALWLHYFDSHEPYTPPAEVAARFTRGYRGPLGNALATDWLVALNDETAPELSARDRRHVADLYDAEIAFLDAQLDRLFRFLKDRGLWHKTLVVVTGDHGQALGERGFWGHGERLLEPVIKVPLLVKLPAQERAATVRAAVQTLDILPTITAYFGLETPPQSGGRSLLPALLGEVLEPVSLRVVERRSYAAAPERRGLALHGGTWKLTYYREGGGSSRHLGRTGGKGGVDGENLYTPGSPEDQLLRQVAATRTVRPGQTPELSPETLEMLRALGYVQ